MCSLVDIVGLFTLVATKFAVFIKLVDWDFSSFDGIFRLVTLFR
jgi:hypothetical protein